MRKSYATRLFDDFGLARADLVAFAQQHPGKIFEPLIQIILDSDQILAGCDPAWEYKSLHDFAVEEFCSDSPIAALAEQIRGDQMGKIDIWKFLHDASGQFGMNLKSWLYYIPEGIELHVKTGPESFRPADDRDASWNLVSTLISNDVDLDGRFHTSPQWARDLFVWRRNYDAYCSIYHDIDMKHPLYEISKEIRRDAVVAYTNGQLNVAAQSEELPTELALALEAYRAVNGDASLIRRKTPKQALTFWLKANHPTLSEGALERIATIANWQPSGGAPKQG